MAPKSTKTEEASISSNKSCVENNKPPFSAICKILSYWLDGQISQGTGVVFRSRTVITVAHNLYRRDANYADKVVVIPGASGTVTPFGKFEVLPTNFDWHRNYESKKQDYEADHYDIGVIWLPQPIGDQTKWWDLSYMSDTESRPGQRVVTCGFLHSPNPQLQMQTGTIINDSDGMIQYDADFGGGLSGSPIWSERKSSPYMTTVALHKGEGRTPEGRPVSIGLKLTEEHYDQIQKWASQKGPALYRTPRGESVLEAEKAPEETKSKGSKKAPAESKGKAELQSNQTVETVVEPGKNFSWNMKLKAGQEIDFTIYAQLAEEDACGPEPCTFSILDEEGGKLATVDMFVNSSGEEFDRETLSFEAEETAGYIARVRSKAESPLKVKVKTKAAKKVE